MEAIKQQMEAVKQVKRTAILRAETIVGIVASMVLFRESCIMREVGFGILWFICALGMFATYVWVDVRAVSKTIATNGE